MTSSKRPYRRILLKVSGEYLKSASIGIDPMALNNLAKLIGEVINLDVEIAIVLGAGNLFRGRTLADAGIGRVTGDQMGILATIINSLALKDALEQIDIPSIVMSSIPMYGIVNALDRRKALKYIIEKKVVIFSGGTGNPLLTTDTAASLRAIEMNADVILKGTKVDGVFTADPKVNPVAKKYSVITYEDVIQQNLGIMDLASVCMCKDYDMPMHVFNICKENTLIDLLCGAEIGTKVVNNKEKTL